MDALSPDRAALVARIRALLETSDVAISRGTLPRLEDVLTTGYAQAHALEAERLRLERRVGEVARALGEGDDHAHGDELPNLGRRLAAAERELEQLRTLLRTLHARTAAVRAAGA